MRENLVSKQKTLDEVKDVLKNFSTSRSFESIFGEPVQPFPMLMVVLVPQISLPTVWEIS